MKKELNAQMSLHTTIKHYRNILIVELNGELDHHTADTVRQEMDEAIIKASVKHLIINAKQLEFMDSSGIGVILGRYKLIKAKQGKMLICNMNETIAKLLELSGIFKIIDTYENESDALSSLEVIS